MDTPAQTSMVRIYKEYDDNVLEHMGCGFLVDSRSILTCRHVVQEALSHEKNLLGKKVVLDFLSPLKSKHQSAKVIRVIERPDLAMLKLLIDSPGDTVPMPLSTSMDLWEHPYRAFGITEGEPEGFWTNGVIKSNILNGTIQIECKSEFNVGKGFSGTPLWDDKIKKVVGMVVMTESDEKIMAAYVIPMIDILKEFPELNPRVDLDLDSIKQKRQKWIQCGFITDQQKNCLDEITDTVTNLWQKKGVSEYLNYFDLYDYRNNISVERMLLELIVGDISPGDPECEKLNAKLEDTLGKDGIFLLIASAWLHDIGLIPTTEEINKINECNADTKWINEKELYQTISQKHYDDRFKTEFEKLKNEYSNETLNILDPRANILTEIIKNHKHDKQDLYKNYIQENDGENYREYYLDMRGKRDARPSTYVHILAAYLRLAETIAVPDSRRNRDTIKAYMTTGLDEFSMIQWIKSKFGDGGTNPIIDHDKHRITIRIKRPKVASQNDKRFENNVKILRNKIEQELQDQLDLISEIMIDGGLSYFSDAKCEITQDSFMKRPDSDQFRQLLTSLPLFEFYSAPNSTAITTAVRSHLDSILDQKESADDDLNKFYTYVLEPLSSTRSCHVFLHTIRDFISQQVRKLNESNSDKEHEGILDNLRDQLKKWNDIDDNIKENLPKIAYGLLSGRAPILLYGYSESIIECIDYAIRSKADIVDTDIYICQCTTKTSYRYGNKLIYSDGVAYIQRLKERGIPPKNIHYVPDSSISNLLSSHKIAKILFGANGIDPLSNKIAHSLGHLTIADVAKIYNIPVFIIADSQKIGLLEEYKFEQRHTKWYPTQFESADLLKEMAINPREDRIPRDLITAIIIDSGIYFKNMDLPKLADVWSAKGKALYNLGKHDEAIQAYDKAIKINPQYVDAWINKGKALCNLGKHDEAIQAYDKAIKINPQYVDAWINKGKALCNLGKHDEAIQAYEKAIKINPQYVDPFFDKAKKLGYSS
jgi:tetratricopeptide (TPR) repeat protein